ncbi:MAG TPA: SGNH/GDSL hydrolase family protein [Solirubrobacterales bacterium]|nr:SGNH/GDSL hydrolase family protein [Solirubrobacterales bacterium]
MSGSASARPPAPQPPAEVKIGKVLAAAGLRSILVPVRYPIQLGGRRANLRVSLLDRNGRRIRSWRLRDRLSSGLERRPEKRDRFTYVHRLDLGAAARRQVRRGARVRVLARGLLDANEDGRPEYGSRDASLQAVPPSAHSGDGHCSSIPATRVRPGRKLVVELPACEARRDWGFLTRPKRGWARIEGGRLIYRPPARFRGTETIELVGLIHPGGASRSQLTPLVFTAFPITVTAAEDPVVRALGDSVTAGFGYYSNGTPMTIGRLPGCRPAAKEYNDACSSNSLNTVSIRGNLEYAPDFGLANDISWPAQWANEHGVTNYANFAVSGSEPADWAPGGELHATTARIESEDPDFMLMTIGANPLLSEMLFGLDNMGCAIESDLFGGYRKCIEAAFAEVHLQANLKSLYSGLVRNTGATIYLMQYHLSVPSTALAYSATQIAMMGKLLNREIAAVAAEVNPQRLRVVTPPHFNVGIDISPVYPSRFSCSRLGYEVDGPSVQSRPTQDELEILHPLSFCVGPNGDASPTWVIGGDTGIHPSATGYTQMASQVPAPR